MNLLEYLNNPFIFGLIVALVMVLLSYLDAKVSKKEKTKIDYFKVFISTGIVSGGLQFLIQKYVGTEQKGGNIPEKIQDLGNDNVSETVSRTFREKRMNTDLPNWG